ncbi:MAG: hypothetical protein ABW042_01995 [Phenylobacterium sp.]
MRIWLGVVGALWLGAGAANATFTSWVWTGEAFALKSAEGMPACRGVSPDDWASEFVSR